MNENAVAALPPTLDVNPTPGERVGAGPMMNGAGTTGPGFTSLLNEPRPRRSRELPGVTVARPSVFASSPAWPARAGTANRSRRS